MERLIERNKEKIFILCVLFTMWCFYSIVRQGGMVSQRLQSLEGSVTQRLQTLKESLELSEQIILSNRYFLITHKHIYSDGRAVTERNYAGSPKRAQEEERQKKKARGEDEVRAQGSHL